MVFCRGARTAQALHAVLSAALPSQHFGLLHGEVLLRSSGSAFSRVAESEMR